ncbi:MAG TPA: NAD-dependent epimerase/dehydratase family protein, partial [Phnomibacter sp.]|nr:NAD-dependent epimerase/dehydratase family protein [Phnomibacter sp.]
MHALITGTAGFIGFHLANRLLAMGWQVTGVDAINDYYDVKLKYDRLAYAGIPVGEIGYNKKITSTIHAGYTFIQLGLEDRANLENVF